jgi:FkbM family methyltransferase
MSIKNIRGHHLLDTYLDSDSVVIDLGAYLGDFSRIISESYHCTVYSVEASPITFKQTHKSSLVHKFNYAIGSDNTVLKFFLGTNPEGNSIFERHRDAKGEFVEVPGISLFRFLEMNSIKKIDLLKIDIEGAEVNLFDSMSDAFLATIPQITVEFHDFISELDIQVKVNQIKDRLSKLGFQYLIFEKPNKDVLFLNKGLISSANFLRISLALNISLGIKTAYNRVKNILKRLLVK